MCRRTGSTSYCCRAFSTSAIRSRWSRSACGAVWRGRCWTARRACAEVYGRTFHKLLLNLRALHPSIEPLVVVDAYGKILGRPGLDSKRRELCTLAAIAMQNAPRQLHAHLRGALNTGSSRDEVDEVIAIVETDLTKERALKLWEMWADVRERALDGK